MNGLPLGATSDPSSYQIRNQDGTPGGWIAQVHVWKDTYESSTVRPLLEKDIKVYPSANEANRVALLMGITWLQRNAT
jgi:hypothetical protein